VGWKNRICRVTVNIHFLFWFGLSIHTYFIWKISMYMQNANEHNLYYLNAIVNFIRYLVCTNFHLFTCSWWTVSLWWSLQPIN
jgi:hypothetical protein